MAGERPAQPPVEALVNQDAHGSNGLQHRELGGFNDGDGLLAFHRRETVEEVFNGFAAFQIINEVLERDACADKDRRSPHDFRIGVNDAFEVFNLHGVNLAWRRFSRKRGVKLQSR